MKLTRILLVTTLLVATASAVYAAEGATPTPEIGPQPTPAAALADILLAPADCDPTAAIVTAGGQEPTPQSQYCGPCSTGNCNGAARGQMCWTGNGWGNCNIYSGGYMCSEGGWECQCASGPLP